MSCRVQDLKHKEVICISDGCALGCICDVEIDIKEAKVISLVIYGRPKCFGLLGREDDIVISCQDIEVIGEDTILVKSAPTWPRRKKGVFSGFFGSN